MTADSTASEVATRSATELVAALRDRTMSSTELLDIYLARHEKLGPTLNAIVTIDEEGARATAAAADDRLARFGSNLTAATAAARETTSWLLEHGATDPNAALAGSAPYLRLLGTVVCGGLMADAALLAADKIDAGVDTEFYEAKLVSAKFFGEQLLPEAAGLVGAVCAGADDLFALTPAQLA